MNNLLVTGGCGFIGANFVRFLFEEAGFQGRVVNNPTTNGRSIRERSVSDIVYIGY